VESDNLKHGNLEEITDQIAKAKLTGIQESVYSVDAEIVAIKKNIDEKRGVIAAADLIAKRLLEETLPVQKAADEERMEMPEAKIRIEVIQKLSEIVRNIAIENRNDLILIRGQVMGLERAAKAMEARFAGEVGKYERWKRIQAEDAADRDARNKIVENAQGAAVEAPPIPEHTPLDKVVKKAIPALQPKVKKQSK
jgi:hypothetical protein